MGNIRASWKQLDIALNNFDPSNRLPRINRNNTARVLKTSVSTPKILPSLTNSNKILKFKEKYLKPEIPGLPKKVL